MTGAHPVTVAPLVNQGVAVVWWLSSWLAEQEVWGWSPGLNTTRFQRLDISCYQVVSPPRWRRGSGLDFGSEDPGSIPSLTLTACGPSDGKEVKDVFGRPGARVEVGSAR